MRPDDLDRLLRRGLYGDNLRPLVDACKDMAVAAPEALPYYVLESVFFDLLQRWDRAVTQDEYNEVNDTLIPLVQSVLATLRQQSDRVETYSALDELVRRFLDLRRSGAISW